jgi:hypothetical protein
MMVVGATADKQKLDKFGKWKPRPGRKDKHHQGATAGKHKLDKFGKWKPRPGKPGRQDKHHQHRLLKKRLLRGNGSESKLRLLDGSLVLSEEHNNGPFSLADVAASAVVNQTTISNTVTMKNNSF